MEEVFYMGEITKSSVDARRFACVLEILLEFQEKYREIFSDIPAGVIEKYKEGHIQMASLG